MIFQPQPERQRDQHLNLADVFTPLKESAKDFFVVIVEAALRARPMGRLMRQPRAGFTGGRFILSPSLSARGATESVQTRRK